MRQQIPARAAAASARLLALTPSRRIGTFCNVLRRGARPAELQVASDARTAVISVSTRRAGEGCLRRSLAIVILCRVRGQWSHWCTGVRTQPLRAHAWVEAGGVPVGEPYPDDCFGLLIRVPETPRRSGGIFGDRIGRVRDPLGNLWWLQTRVEDVSPEEMERRLGDPKWARAMAYVQGADFSRGPLFQGND
ncbi:lasso peptide biosynthesis B2 protein [Streptomyces hawaiiensis]|uniref:lasso peptide biosynthesis B2 protein n=1 Tax=Streptomyces hawaiiensis TaxID=67305 RepID=UPI003662696C